MDNRAIEQSGVARGSHNQYRAGSCSYAECIHRLDFLAASLEPISRIEKESRIGSSDPASGLHVHQNSNMESLYSDEAALVFKLNTKGACEVLYTTGYSGPHSKLPLLRFIISF